MIVVVPTRCGACNSGPTFDPPWWLLLVAIVFFAAITILSIRAIVGAL